jgi:hypothetical protein
MGTGIPFPGGKARPGCDADHSFPSNEEVKKDYELLPPAPPFCVVSLLYFLSRLSVEKVLPLTCGTMNYMFFYITKSS